MKMESFFFFKSTGKFIYLSMKMTCSSKVVTAYAFVTPPLSGMAWNGME